MPYADRHLGLKPLRKSYFYDAMDYFREEYPNVVFLWVSDDMEWAKNQINNKHGDIYFVGKLNQVLGAQGAHLEALWFYISNVKF